LQVSDTCSGSRGVQKGKGRTRPAVLPAEKGGKKKTQGRLFEPPKKKKRGGGYERFPYVEKERKGHASEDSAVPEKEEGPFVAFP